MAASAENRSSKANRLLDSLEQKQADRLPPHEPGMPAILQLLGAADDAGLLPPWCPRSCKIADEALQCVVDDRCYIECLDSAEDIARAR